MKKIAIFSALCCAFYMFSCSNSPIANNMADELCASMEKITAEEPMGKYDAASDITEIRKKPEYKDVTDAQIKKAMMKKCPEGYKQYLTIKDK